jgi:hypothetical protein
VAATVSRARSNASAALGLALEVDAEIEIPGLGPSPDRAPGSPRATRVRLDRGELQRRWEAVKGRAQRVRELRDGDAVRLTVELAEPAGYLLHAPGFARILVAADGSELLCRPEREGEEWSTLLFAQGLPLAATLRGLEVLHASAVVMTDGAWRGKAALFSGPQGAGKSSLAAALLRRGQQLLSDDTVALEPREGELLAHPGPALLQLRAEEHERLSERERTSMGRATQALGKRRFAPLGRCGEAPFGGLFLLERSRGATLERIERIDPFALLATTFNLSVRDPARLTRHLDLAAALADSGNVFRLRVQPAVDAGQLADTLLARLAEL